VILKLAVSRSRPSVPYGANLFSFTPTPPIFTARGHAKRDICRDRCQTVCLTAMRLTQVGVLPKRLNIGSLKQRSTTAHGL